MNCRFGLKRAADLKSIVPGSSQLECNAEALQPGPFSAQLHVFVDDGGTRELVFSINGTALPVRDKKTSRQ